ncbi:hypothetical protein [Mangrovibacterium sp.]|uniref:hypothetical protein n=1 Tax=Mangrovibacterium sp. TaxID=1961364 RepID=UPI003566636D
MKVISMGPVTYIPEAKAILKMPSSAEIITEPDDVEKIGNYEIVPWGDGNTLPADVLKKIKKSEVVGANLEFNVSAGYGQGIKPMRRVVENNKIVGYEDVFDDEVLEFFEDNDISGYFLEQLTDLKAFYNVFPEIIVSTDKKKIVSLRSKEAVFSRWGVIDPNKGRITKHFYSAKWGDSPKKEDIAVTDVLDRFNPLMSLNEYLKATKPSYRYVLPVNMPTPGRTYYQEPYWWSIFLSGWYDFSQQIPLFKTSKLKHALGVKKIIYISPKYFENIFKEENIDPNDKEAVAARVAKEHTAFNDFLTGEQNFGKALVAIKEMVHSGSGAKEEKHIEIVDVPDKMEGGEYIEDSEEVSNVISYAMASHQSLIGSVPGKSKGSMSGTDKRELFQIKQALMKPTRDRLMRPLTLIKRFNGWDKNIVFAVPDFEFTTLDVNKSGKELAITT